MEFIKGENISKMGIPEQLKSEKTTYYYKKDFNIHTFSKTPPHHQLHPPKEKKKIYTFYIKLSFKTLILQKQLLFIALIHHVEGKIYL